MNISTSVHVHKDIKQNIKIGNDPDIAGSSTVFSKFEKHDPLVWYLYPDLVFSAKCLSNGFLNKSISSAVQLMFCTHYYFGGIHTPRIFKLLFNQEHYDETVERMFPGFDIPYKFKFSFYKNSAAKWARRCYEHYDLMEQYLIAMLNEWNYRFPNSPHKLSNVAFYLIEQNNIKSKLPKANLSSIQLDYKCISKKYRNKDLFLSYRNFYASKIDNPILEYADSKRDVPEFLSFKAERPVNSMLR